MPSLEAHIRDLEVLANIHKGIVSAEIESGSFNPRIVPLKDQLFLCSVRGNPFLLQPLIKISDRQTLAISADGTGFLVAQSDVRNIFYKRLLNEPGQIILSTFLYSWLMEGCS